MEPNGLNGRAPIPSPHALEIFEEDAPRKKGLFALFYPAAPTPEEQLIEKYRLQALEVQAKGAVRRVEMEQEKLNRKKQIKDDAEVDDFKYQLDLFMGIRREEHDLSSELLREEREQRLFSSEDDMLNLERAKERIRKRKK